jgi:IS30 family transposase
MSCNHHLSFAERYYIAIGLKIKMSHNQIAQAIGYSQSTVSREISRNTGLMRYRYKQADRFAGERHACKAKAVKMTDEIKHIVSICLQHDRSPEQIAGRLREEEVVSLRHETIYQYLPTDKANGGQRLQAVASSEENIPKTLRISS